MYYILVTRFEVYVHKGRPLSGWRGFVQCRHFVDKGGRGLQMQTSALFGAKNFGFF